MDEDTRRLPFPSEQVVTGRAGSVLVWNGHTWHSATLNTSPTEPRASLTSFFGTHEFADACGAGTREAESEALPPSERGVGMLGRACLDRLSGDQRRFYERKPAGRL